MKWSAEAVRSVRSGLGLTQEDFGRLYGVAGRTVKRWEQNGLPDRVEANSQRALEAAKADLAKRNRPSDTLMQQAAAALHDLPYDDLLAIWSDIKRRQAIALARAYPDEVREALTKE